MFFVIVGGCKKKDTFNKKKSITKLITEVPKYAKGFDISYSDQCTLLKVYKSWPGSQKTHTYHLVNNSADNHFCKSEKNVIIKQSAQKIAVTSTTHIPMLVLMKEIHRLVAFPETKYISSPKVRERIDSGDIIDLGPAHLLQVETLLRQAPNWLMTFGIEGVDKTHHTIKNAGIPVIYNGDWLEESPLGRTEWIKVFGALFNKKKLADSIFNSIEESYLNVKKKVESVKKRPTVLSGAIHQNIWYLPGGNSIESQFMEDAKLDYLWKNNQNTGSLALSVEAVLLKAQTADIWLNPSNFSSMNLLMKSNRHYKQFKAFKDNEVFSVALKTGITGGVWYYEWGVARPDWVLKDLIKIGHPEMLPLYEPKFYMRLPE